MLARVIKWMTKTLVLPEDDVALQQSKLLVFGSLVVIGSCGVLWSALYLVLQCWWPAVFPFLYTGMAIIGALHFIYTKRIEFARACLTYGLILCPLGIYWVFGKEYSSVMTNWAFLGPQLAVTLGYAMTLMPLVAKNHVSALRCRARIRQGKCFRARPHRYGQWVVEISVPHYMRSGRIL